MENLEKLESDLWEAADQLRANSKLTASEYSMPVLGLIFLRHAHNRFLAVKADVEKTLPKRGGVTAPITREHFQGKAAIFLPEKAQYEYLANLPEGEPIGQRLAEAMKLIEDEQEILKGVLPKEYTTFEPSLLQELVKIFNRKALQDATGDIFGRIYEYFLNKFAMTGAQEGGEFFTPPSLVNMIVNVLCPNHGKVLDPFVGSAGMFVQTGHFLTRNGQEPNKAVTFYGQEKADVNTRLALMNLAVHGLEGHIIQGNTFYADEHQLEGKCDFVMANPPFNVDGVLPEKTKAAGRLPFELPGLNAKTKSVGNANYLCIQYFFSYLNDQGRAGFVMASSASDAGHAEKRIRQDLIKTGAVDVMIAIGTNFFYTRTLPCTLWFFDKGKPESRKDKVLMIDARNVYRTVSRKIRDFSPEHLKNLSIIVSLYRGNQSEYLKLVKSYLDEVQRVALTVPTHVEEFDTARQLVMEHIEAFSMVIQPGPEIDEELLQGFRLLVSEIRVETGAYSAERFSVMKELADQVKWYAQHRPQPPLNEDQRTCYARWETVLPKLKALGKQADHLQKLVVRAKDMAERQLKARSNEDWNTAAVKRTMEALEQAHEAAHDAIRLTIYSQYQTHWLQSRFPGAVYVDVPGLCKLANLSEIEANDWSLMPGRYVGVGVEIEADEQAFEARLREIHAELDLLNEETSLLADLIQGQIVEILQ